jgi:HPt (histidine-containing phosphotransfer) domain-containing protein
MVMSFNSEDTFDDDAPEIDVSDINISGVDAEMGSSLYGGEMDIYLSVLQSFVTHTPAAIDSLRAVSAATLPAYATNVHGLKGSCASIGAESVREKAYYLEMRSKANDLEEVLSKNEALITEAEQLVKNIQAWLEKKT